MKSASHPCNAVPYLLLTLFMLAFHYIVEILVGGSICHNNVCICPSETTQVGNFCQKKIGWWLFIVYRLCIECTLRVWRRRNFDWRALLASG